MTNRLADFTFTDRQGVKHKRCSGEQRRELYRLCRVDPELAGGFEKLLRERSRTPRTIFDATGQEAGAILRWWDGDPFR